MSGPGALNDGLLSGRLSSSMSRRRRWRRSGKRPLERRAGARALHGPKDALRACLANPNVKTIADLTDKDRIAVPTVKISGQAMILQMAAAKRWGFEQYERLDACTVSMAHPDAMRPCSPANGQHAFRRGAIPVLRTRRLGFTPSSSPTNRRHSHQRHPGHDQGFP